MSKSNPQTIPGSLAAIVLCGGKSSRMGVDKSQLVFGDGNQQTTFLTRIVSAISSSVSTVVVVCDSAQSQYSQYSQQSLSLPGDVILTQDRAPNRGPLEGIAAGLAALPKNIESAFVTSCDVPGIRAEIIPLLAAQLGEFEAVVPVDDARVYGLTAIYRRSILPKLDELIERNMLRVSEVIQYVNATQVSLDLLRSVDPQLNSLANINTLADYQALAKRVGFQLPQELREELPKEGEQ